MARIVRCESCNRAYTCVGLPVVLSANYVAWCDRTRDWRLFLLADTGLYQLPVTVNSRLINLPRKSDKLLFFLKKQERDNLKGLRANKGSNTPAPINFQPDGDAKKTNLGLPPLHQFSKAVPE